MSVLRQVPLLFVLLATSLLLNIYFLFFQPAQNKTIVQKVVDGDTIVLETGQRIRLLGVDAPEIDRCYGKEATEALKTLVLERPVRIAEGKPDAYGRTMALVYLNKTLVNTEVIRLGFARPDYTKNSQKDAFIAAYNEAKENNLGINSVCKITDSQPANPECTIKGNIDQAIGKKFYHFPNCSHYKQIVIDTSTEEQFFCSETEAINAGFKKAAGCP
jgi:micrococcal nuclease